jgi:hypothetical protein
VNGADGFSIIDVTPAKRLALRVEKLAPDRPAAQPNRADRMPDRPKGLLKDNVVVMFAFF